MTQLHALLDLEVALGLVCTALADVVLLLRALGPVGGRAPHDGGQAPVLLELARLDRLRALLRVPVLVVAHVALQAPHCSKWE